MKKPTRGLFYSYSNISVARVLEKEKFSSWLTINSRKASMEAMIVAHPLVSMENVERESVEGGNNIIRILDVMKMELMHSNMAKNKCQSYAIRNKSSHHIFAES